MVSQLILAGTSVLYNITKVYQSWTPGKVFFFNMASKMAAETSMIITNIKFNDLDVYTQGFGGKKHIEIIKNDVGPYI